MIFSYELAGTNLEGVVGPPRDKDADADISRLTGKRRKISILESRLCTFSPRIQQDKGHFNGKGHLSLSEVSAVTWSSPVQSAHIGVLNG